MNTYASGLTCQGTSAPFRPPHHAQPHGQKQFWTWVWLRTQLPGRPPCSCGTTELGCPEVWHWDSGGLHQAHPPKQWEVGCHGTWKGAALILDTVSNLPKNQILLSSVVVSKVCLQRKEWIKEINLVHVTSMGYIGQIRLYHSIRFCLFECGIYSEGEAHFSVAQITKRQINAVNFENNLNFV